MSPAFTKRAAQKSCKTKTTLDFD